MFVLLWSLYLRILNLRRGENSMWDDVIINEVRTNGEAIVKECDYDLHKYFLRIKRGIKKLKKEGWKIVGKNDIETISSKTQKIPLEIK